MRPHSEFAGRIGGPAARSTALKSRPRSAGLAIDGAAVMI